MSRSVLESKDGFELLFYASKTVTFSRIIFFLLNCCNDCVFHQNNYWSKDLFILFVTHNKYMKCCPLLNCHYDSSTSIKVVNGCDFSQLRIVLLHHCQHELKPLLTCQKRVHYL